MTALECFNEFKTRRVYETFIDLKEDKVLKKFIYAFFVCYKKSAGSIFEERAQLHSTPVHIQTHDFRNQMERFL